MRPQQEGRGANTQSENTQHEMRTMEEADDLKKIDTVDALQVDLENSGAIKGDDSDGRVNWTRKQILATISLSGLYVGQFACILACIQC